MVRGGNPKVKRRPASRSSHPRVRQPGVAERDRAKPCGTARYGGWTWAYGTAVLCYSRIAALPSSTSCRRPNSASQASTGVVDLISNTVDFYESQLSAQGVYSAIASPRGVGCYQASLERNK